MAQYLVKTYDKYGNVTSAKYVNYSSEVGRWKQVVLDSKTVVLDRLVYGFTRAKLFELWPMTI